MAEPSLPSEPVGDVVHFRKQFVEGGQEYTYAGVRVGELWYLTGAMAPQGMDWESLVQWLADTSPSVPTIRAADSSSFGVL